MRWLKEMLLKSGKIKSVDVRHLNRASTNTLPSAMSDETIRMVYAYIIIYEYFTPPVFEIPL